jgi:acylphosphatase
VEDFDGMGDDLEVIRMRVLVSGAVQGVFFRATCASRARGAGLGGFVRNLADGRVEAAFEGPRDDVEALVSWCRAGPPGANVEDVQLVDEKPAGDRGFRVLR